MAIEILHNCMQIKYFCNSVKLTSVYKQRIKPIENVHFLFSGIFVCFTDLIPFLGCLVAATKLHKTLLNGVLRAALAFFEVTPIGRILSRFSKDIDVVDITLPGKLIGLIYCFFEVISQFLKANLKNGK